VLRCFCILTNTSKGFGLWLRSSRFFLFGCFFDFSQALCIIPEKKPEIPGGFRSFSGTIPPIAATCRIESLSEKAHYSRCLVDGLEMKALEEGGIK
jgi:hypothetical protein